MLPKLLSCEGRLGNWESSFRWPNEFAATDEGRQSNRGTAVPCCQHPPPWLTVPVVSLPLLVSFLGSAGLNVWQADLPGAWQQRTAAPRLSWQSIL